MIMKLYSVRDKLTGFAGPIAFKEDKIASRWFESFCKAKKEQEYTEAKYFELYCIGTFDTDKGVIIGMSSSELELIIEGEQFDEHKD